MKQVTVVVALISAFLALSFAAGAYQEAHAAPAAVAAVTDSGPAAVSTPPAPDTDLGGFLAVLMDHVKQSEWLPVFGLGLMLVAWGIRAGAAALGSTWVKTKTGGRVIAFGAALTLTFGTAVASGQALSVGLLGTALAAAWAASGAHEDRKDLAGA